MMKNSIKKDVVAFSELEKEFHLFDRKYNGIEYWDAIRFSVCEAAFTTRYAVKNTIKRWHFKKIQTLILSLKSVIEYSLIGKKDILLFSMSRLHSRFFKYLVFPNKTKSVLCKTWWKDTKLTDDYVLPVFPIRLVSKLVSGSWNKDHIEREFLDKLEKIVSNRFGQSLTASEMEKMIFSYISDREAYIAFFETLIKKTRCKLIILTCYYSNIYYYLIEAAHNCGIKVIELQHGVINNHIAYTYADTNLFYKHVPDYLLTFGDSYSEWISLPKSEKVIATGSPYQQAMSVSFDEVKPDEKLIIVYPKLSETFEKMICELADSITSKGYRIIVKMHPGEAEQYKQYYPIISENKNVEIETRQDRSIYYWLKSAKHHIMASSTVGMEAVMYEHTCIYIAENVDHAQVQPLLDWKAARSFSSAAELERQIRNPVFLDKTESRQKLWKDNSVENVKACIERIITES